MTYLSLVDGQAFKFMIEAGLFDTRLCVDPISKEKWADLIIKAFGYYYILLLSRLFFWKI